MPNHNVKGTCPVCGCKTSKPKNWFRVVRNLVVYSVLFASLISNGRK